MASTYNDLKLELIGTGEQAGTWGDTTNINLGTAISEAITGSVNIAFSSADVTLTLTNTNASQSARNLRLNLTGTSGGARNLILGSGCQIEKFYLINNGLADAVTVKNTTGTGVTIPAGTAGFVFNNSTNVVNPLTYYSGTLVSSNATISGGNIDGTVIGGSGIANGSFASLSCTDGILNGVTVGAVNPGPGAFTSLTATTASIPTITSNTSFSSTGSVKLPAGTTGQQPVGVAGMIRYNTSTNSFEGYNGTAWGNIGGGGGGGNSTTAGLWQNIQTISTNQTISSGYSASSAGPITVAGGVTVTVPSGSRWVIL